MSLQANPNCQHPGEAFCTCKDVGELAQAAGSDLEQDPYETEQYQRFVASMVPHCHCRANNCPCDGVLAGGPCDMVQEEEPWPSYDDDEE